ncbi:MFS transporter [Streptomyces sp. YIM 98790]|uniref:MFS transporter n=1 Tax=Streptomyces sp. YIM 98790 TaxID=2689077 RepID=UPI0014074AD4|nr:MFS transporter [Streptomyces sp. YIM 98790]
MAGAAATRGAVTGTATRPRPRAVLPALCVTQITGWGILYYAFPVLNPHITAGTGWPPTATTAAFSAALLVSALAGIPVGRAVDRHGPRAVMTAGSATGAAAVLAMAWAPGLPAFTAAWLLAGAAMAATFYQPAFAALTRWWGPDRLRALTILTLAGGLASTAFAPLTAALAAHHTWRTTYTLLALLLAAVTLPAHALALRAPWPPPAAAPGGHHQAAPDTRTVTRSRPFLLLATALTLSGFALSAGVITLVPLLTERGVTATTAAWALGLGGAGQTLGRLLYSPLARRTGVTARTVLLLLAGAVTTAAVGLVPGPVLLLIVAAVAAGLIRGNVTLLRATAVTDRWGTAHYGHRSAVLAAPVTIAGALAPAAATALASFLGGYPRLFALLAALSALAALLALAGTPSPARRSGGADTGNPARRRR